MLKHLPNDALKKLKKKKKQKKKLYSKESVYYNDVNVGRRNHNEDGLNAAILAAAQIVTLKRITPRA